MIFLLRRQHGLEERRARVLTDIKSLASLVVALADVGDTFGEVVEEPNLSGSAGGRCVGCGWGREIRVESEVRRGAGRFVWTVENGGMSKGADGFMIWRRL